jgi:hypothetical protein
MPHFVVTTEGGNRLGLRQDYANDLWVPAHLSGEQAALFALDCFKWAVLAEIELLDVRAVDGTEGMSTGEGAGQGRAPDGPAL